jgi:hypothetical protein
LVFWGGLGEAALCFSGVLAILFSLKGDSSD